MVDHTIIIDYANDNGTFNAWSGNGTDDTLTVRISDDVGMGGNTFSWSFYSSETDGEVELATFILPPGWYAHMYENFSYPPGGAGYDPVTWYRHSIYVYDDNGTYMGIIGIVETNAQPAFTNAPCFTRGSKILCADGIERPVETLSEGAMIQTMDRGAQPLRWIGSTVITGETLSQFPNQRPVRIAANALGEHEELLVSPQHRMYVRDPRVTHFTNSEDALVPAKGLVNDDTIRVADDLAEVEYFHLMFDQHEIVRGDGAWSESFRPGNWMMSELDKATRDEVVAFFPELETDPESYSPPARPLMRVGQAKRMFADE